MPTERKHLTVCGMCTCTNSHPAVSSARRWSHASRPYPEAEPGAGPSSSRSDSQASEAFVQVTFDSTWNQHTHTSLTLLPFGLWAPGESNPRLLLEISLSPRLSACC